MGGQGRVQAEGGQTGTYAFIKVHRRSASGFPGKLDWSIQTKKVRVLVSFAGGSSKGYTRGKAPGRGRDCFSLWLCSCCKGMLTGGARVSSRPLQATGHTKGR